METQIVSFSQMFHCINDLNSHTIMLKCSPQLASHDKSSINFSVSLSAARNVINCLPFSKSQAQVEWGHETIGSSQLVRVKFQLKKECKFGDSFLMVGDDPILGSWNPSDAIPFCWSEGHIWSLLLDLPVEKSIQYKILLKKTTGEILWQPGPDRSFQAWGTKNVIIVTEQWDKAEAQKISEEQNFEEIEEPSALDSSTESLNDNLNSEGNRVEDLGFDENTSIGDRNETDLKSSSSSTTVAENPNTKAQKKVEALNKGNERRLEGEKISVEEEGNLVIDDEGPVLVPGLTLPYSSSEEVSIKEKKKHVSSDK